MNRTILVMLGSVFLAGLMYVLMSTDPRPRPQFESQQESAEQTSQRGSQQSSQQGSTEQAGAMSELMLHCAASNRAVIEEICDRYQAEFGRTIHIQYGPSQTLLSSIEVTQKGDLYLPADDSFLEMARKQSLVAEVLPLAKMQGVIAVKKGNPRGIQSFQDLLREDIKLVQANEAAAIGKQTQRELTTQGLWDPLHNATHAYRTTVTDVANDVIVGAADAGIVYDAVLTTYPELEFVEIPEFEKIAAKSALGVLSNSEKTQSALHFARYVAAQDRGLESYAKHGFRTEQGDVWADIPELSIFAGSMLRPAIEDTITAFEQREGVRVTRVYNGCGILVGQMKSGKTPDAYFACDTEFMNQVTDLFPEAVPVSQNELVIVVQKGNPKKIGSLRDLARPGLKVGIGHEKQCAMGWITQNTFREGGLQQELMPNVTMQAPTGDLLVNQMIAGSLDAAVVYLSNAAGAAESLDAIRIRDIDCSTATQPWAVAAKSKYPQLASRLFESICSADSQDTFAAEGFTWKVEAPQDEANVE